MKKILILSDFYAPHWTGLAQSITRISEVFSEKNKVYVLTTQHNKNLPRYEIKNSISIRRVPYLFSLSRLQYAPLTSLYVIIKILQSEIIFINSPYSHILPASLFSWVSRKKIIIFHQGDLILPKGIVNWCIERIFDISTQIACLLAHTISTYTSDYAQNSRILKKNLDKFQETMVILPTNIHRFTTSFSIHKKLLELKKRGKILFGCAGRFVEEKGFDILLKAIPLIKKQLPSAQFVFAGELRMKYETSYFKNHKKLIEKAGSNFLSLGLLKQPELSQFYSALDFFVLPSRSDCFSLVQVEAMLHKVPCIVSAIPGAQIPVKKTGFGLLYKSENPENIARACSLAVSQRSAILKQYSKVTKFFDLTKSEESIHALIER